LKATEGNPRSVDGFAIQREQGRRRMMTRLKDACHCDAGPITQCSRIQTGNPAAPVGRKDRGLARRKSRLCRVYDIATVENVPLAWSALSKC
jgi:hypothetical protein